MIAVLLGALLAADAGGAPLSCARALSAGRARLEKVKLERRIRPTLELIGRACLAEDARLADAAARAARQPRAERARLLGSAQSLCALADPAAAASTIEATCPPGPNEPQGPILADLDAGTYAFVRALRARLAGDAGVEKNAELVLSSLALAAALEGEALRNRAGPAR